MPITPLITLMIILLTIIAIYQPRHTPVRIRGITNVAGMEIRLTIAVEIILILKNRPITTVPALTIITSGIALIRVATVLSHQKVALISMTRRKFVFLITLAMVATQLLQARALDILITNFKI